MPNKLFGYLVCCIVLSLVLCACNSSSPAIPQTPTQVSTPTPNPTNTPASTHTLTPTPSSTPTVTLTPSPTSSPTPIPTPIGGKTPYLAFIGKDENDVYNFVIINLYSGETITKEALTYEMDPKYPWIVDPIERGGNYAISWSEDASKIIFNTGGLMSNSLELYDVQTKVLNKIIDLPPNFGITQFIWSPGNNSWVAYKYVNSGGDYNANVWFADLSHDPTYPRAIIDKTSYELYFNWVSDGLKLWTIADTGLGLIIKEFNPVNGNTKVISKAEDEILTRITKRISPTGKWEFVRGNPYHRLRSSIIDRQSNNSVESDCIVIGFLGWSPDEKSSIVFCLKNLGKYDEIMSLIGSVPGSEYKNAFPEFITKFNGAESEMFQIAILENSTGNILYSHSFPNEIIPMIPWCNYHIDNHLGLGLGIGWK